MITCSFNTFFFGIPSGNHVVSIRQSRWWKLRCQHEILLCLYVFRIDSSQNWERVPLLHVENYSSHVYITYVEEIFHNNCVRCLSEIHDIFCFVLTMNDKTSKILCWPYHLSRAFATWKKRLCGFCWVLKQHLWIILINRCIKKHQISIFYAYQKEKNSILNTSWSRITKIVFSFESRCFMRIFHYMLTFMESVSNSCFNTCVLGISFTDELHEHLSIIFAWWASKTIP